MDENESNQEINIGSMSGGVIANRVTGGITQHNVTQGNQEQIDFERLATELAQLRKAMRDMDTEDEYVINRAEIQKAEQAAKKKDWVGVQAHLKEAGKWSFDVATKVGASLISEILKLALGLK